MIKTALLTTFAFLLMTFLIPVNKVQAFSSGCPNPGGTVIASYPTGMHQIVGGGLLSGSDTVYKINDNLFIQCFCPDNGGTGIQTVFMKTNTSPGSGWIQINGIDWGLPAGTYFARNSSSNCNGCNTTTNVTISGNGADSHNSASINVNKQKTVTQNNNANISNSITVKQETGGNKANKNTGGNTTITTGSSFSDIAVTNKVNFNWSFPGL